MLKARNLFFVLHSLVFGDLALAQDPAQLESIQHCDIPTGDLGSSKAKDPSECLAACKGNPACAAYTFISGWNRCFLKSSTKKREGIRFYSGKYSQETKTVTEEGYDIDYPGRDIPPGIPNVAHHKDCLEACTKNAKCVAFGYIEGYRQCWLKSKADLKQTKIFWCGIVRPKTETKPSSP